MAISINTNIVGLTALRHLRAANDAFLLASERIASGKKINRASDNPSGLVFVESLKAQIASLNQASINVQVVKSLIDTADAGLSQIAARLTTIRTLILEARSDTSKVATNQTQVDEAVSAINRIANTTRFNEKSLLNGLSGYFTSTVDSRFTSLSLRRILFGTSERLTFTFSITRAASHAGLSIGGFGASSGSIRVTGNLGTTTVKITPSTSVSGAINAVRDFTGVFASGGVAFSEGFGSAELVTIAVASGTGYTGAVGSDKGADIGATVSGIVGVGNGLGLRVSTARLAAEVSFTSGATVGSTVSFTAVRSGLVFQLGSEATAHDELLFGLPGVTASQLGRSSISVFGETVQGLLESITSGGGNSLSANIGNALRIVDDSSSQVSGLRAFYGSISANSLTPMNSLLQSQILELTKTRSLLEDADIAEETLNQTRALALFNTGKAVVAQASSLTTSILTLLQPSST